MILTAPFVHGSLEHVASNTFPLFFLSAMLFSFYPKFTFRILLYIIIVAGLGIWLFARPNYHIGASILVYGLAAFEFLSGIILKKRKLMALSLVIVLLYGGLWVGLLPLDPHVSFEGHIAGALAGASAVLWYRRRIGLLKPPKEKEDDEENYFKINDYIEI